MELILYFHKLTPPLFSYTSAVEKPFFVSTRTTSPKEYEVSNDGRSCNLYPSSYFTAYITPSPEYPVPLFMYLDTHHMTLSEKQDDSSGDLVGYFYVSMTPHKNSSSVHYVINKDKYGEYISEFGRSPPEKNWTKNVVYVKSHQVYEGNRLMYWTHQLDN